MMVKWFSLGFWALLARLVLRNRIIILVSVVLITIFLALQWKNIKFTYTEANLLPDDEVASIEYKAFLEKFGEEGNLIIIGSKSDSLFTPEAFEKWSEMMQGFQKNKSVDLVLSIDNLKQLQKNDSLQTFELKLFLDHTKTKDAQYLSEKVNELRSDLPFYEGLLFNKKTGTIRGAIYLHKNIVNTAERKDFVLEILNPAIEKFEQQSKVNLHISGMPYIRTMSTETIKGEIGLFIGASLLVTSLLFYFFFRSFRATLISIIIVIIGVMWSFGILGLFNYEITILTSLVPSLIIVIGIPNCIFLTNKYHQEYKVHKNKAKALQRVTTKIGMATLITNVTTAIGFGTFVTSNNQLLIEFGIVTAINIFALFFLCLFVIPIFHSYIPAPVERHLEHLDRGSVRRSMDWILRNVKTNRTRIYTVVSILLLLSIVGVLKMRITGSIIEDMPKKTRFFQDIVFFEDEFDGIMPLEIVIDTKRKKGVMKLSTLNKMEQFETEIQKIEGLSKPISVVNLVKYAKQAYYNGNPEYFALPSPQEQSFILSYVKNTAKDSKDNVLKSYVDDDGQVARITTFIRDDNGENLPAIEASIRKIADEIFPKGSYDVSITGKSLVFQRGTNYLLDNLLSSLAFAFFLTALLIGFMFRSFKMILVALIPNLLPLMMTAGIMGFFGIPLKPSTILVFGIAFGLSVDDTVRFLSQYREELKSNNWKIKKSVYATFNDAGLSMFYTSIVLFFGFSVFMLSSFGGTIALGGLVSITLCFGMLSNLMLLPALVLTMNKRLANAQELPEPNIRLKEYTDEEIDDLDNKKV